MSEEEDQEIIEERRRLKEYIKVLGLDVYDPERDEEFSTPWKKYINKNTIIKHLRTLPKNIINGKNDIKQMIQKLSDERDELEKELQKWLTEYMLDKISANYFWYLWVLEDEKKREGEK